MAIPSSGTLTFADLQAEFGGSHPISISEYYRDGALVPGNNTNVPTSGAIALSNFYGAVNEIGVTASGGAALDLSTLFSAANYSGTIPKRVTVNAGTTIGSMTIPTFAGTLTIDNAGEIQGARGSGNGAAGGHAIVLSGGTLVVNNTGAIRGAGGNGNTGSAGGAGGNGNYAQGCTSYSTCSCPYWCASGTRCGGGCVVVGLQSCGPQCGGNDGDDRDVCVFTCYNTVSTSGGAGGAGGGTSGLGQGYGVSNTNGSAGSSGAGGGTNAGTGGTGSAASNGGTWGVAGGNSATGATGANGNVSSGSGGTAGKSGGAAGKAISVVGGSRTLNNTGTINGATS